MAGPNRTIDVVEETVSITRRPVEAGRVAVRLTTAERDAPVEVALRDQHMRVERVPVGRFVEAAPTIRTEGDTTIIPVLEEHAVTTVRLFLREEIRVTRDTATRTERHTVRLRAERADIERLDTTTGEMTHE